MPGSAFRPTTPALPGRLPAAGVPLLSPSCARGGTGDKTPQSTLSWSDLEPDGSRGAAGLMHARLGACPGLPGLGPHGSLPVNSGVGERR